VKTYEQEHYTGESSRDRAMREAADAYEAYGVTHGLITEELGYVFDLEQYPGQDLGRGSQDPDRIQPIDLMLPNQWRFNTDKIEESAPIHINCKPTERTDADPTIAAEKVAQMRRALEWTLLYNPVNNYADVRSRYIGGAQAGRLWSARWDWITELGDNGELVPRLVDPRNLMLPRGYLTPHDPLCPALFEIVRMPVNEARRKKGWKGTATLQADDGQFSIAQALSSAKRDTAESPLYDRASKRSDSRDAGEGWATFLLVWRRFEKTKPDPKVELAPERRTMTCGACGYTTPPQGQVQQVADQAGMPFDGFPEIEDGCPECVTGALRRQDFRTKSPKELKSEQGKVLEIHCLNGSMENAAYEGPWPCPRARTFPYLWLGAYLFPHRAVSESNVSWGWPVSAARNFTNRVLLEQAHRSRPFTVLPDDGLEDRNGQRFEPGEDGDDFAYATRDFPDSHLQVIQAQPVNAALFQLNEMFSAQFHGTEGNDQINIPAGSTRDIAASSLQLQSDSGNVPINGFVRRLYNAESTWFGVASDYIAHFWRVPRQIPSTDPMGETPGGIVWDEIYGPEMPNVDVVVGAGVDTSQLRSEDLQALKEMMMYPRPMRRALGMAAGLDHYVLDMMDQIEAAETPPMQPGSPGAPPGPSQSSQPPGRGGRPNSQQSPPPRAAPPMESQRYAA
jgi:hypothetical protein